MKDTNTRRLSFTRYQCRCKWMHYVRQEPFPAFVASKSERVGRGISKVGDSEFEELQFFVGMNRCQKKLAVDA